MFSGNIVELDKTKLTVRRSVPDKPDEKRTFLIKPETKVEGKLRTRARVTVGYMSNEEGDVAMRIIVRTGVPSSPLQQRQAVPPKVASLN